MSLSSKMTMLVLVAAVGCNDGKPDRASVPSAVNASPSSGSATKTVSPTTPSFLEYSFLKSDGTESSNRIERFSDADIRAAMSAIPWAEGRFATIQISHDGINALSVFRNSEDEQSRGQIIAQLAKQTDGEWSFNNSSPLRDAEHGLELLLSYYRKDGTHETLVKWSRVE